MNSPRHSPRSFVALLVLLALVLAACGTRRGDDDFVLTQVADGDDVSGFVADGGGSTDGATVDGAVDGEIIDGAPGADGATADGSGGDGSASGGGGAATGGDGASTGGGTDGAAGGGAAGPNEASDVGVTETTIRLGTIVAENGVLGDTFAPAVRGLRAWVAHTNAEGGVHGRKVELFTCDDREDRARTLECARQLVEQDEVFALVAVNTRSFGGATQYLHEQKIPVMGFPINNAFYRFPRIYTIYGTPHTRDGKTVGEGGELEALTGLYRWFKDNLDVTKAAVFAYDIAESKQAGDRFAQGLELEGYEVTQYAVSFAAPSFDQAVADMERRGIEIIFDAMDDGANRRLCDSMARRNFKPKAKVPTVVSMNDAIGDNYNETCRNVLYTNTESRPYSADHPEVKEFRAAYARYQPGLGMHQWALEAWAQGNIVRDGLLSMGPAPTRDGLVKYLDSMKPNTAEGIMVGTDFARVKLSAGPTNDCFNIVRWQDSKGGWVQAASKFPFCYPDAKRYFYTSAENGT